MCRRGYQNKTDLRSTSVDAEQTSIRTLCPRQGARGLLMDGTAVESAFALLLTKVTKHDCHIWRFKMKERRFIEEDN